MQAVYTDAEIQEIKENFLEYGFVKISPALADQLLQGVKRDLAPFFGDKKAQPRVVPYADHNRVQDAWHISKNVYEVAMNHTIIKVLNELIGMEMAPFQTLNFYKGTGQGIHADSIHFNSKPFAAMCGVWVALEDVAVDQGPLEYYPGSHKREEMNLDFFDIKVGEEDSYSRYIQGISKVIEKEGYQKEFGILKKGEAIIWSANLLHGGSPLLDPTKTRQSQVTHYYARGIKYWRPLQSVSATRYFKPNWVVDVHEKPTKNPIKRAVMILRASFERVQDKIQSRVSR